MYVRCDARVLYISVSLVRFYFPRFSASTNCFYFPLYILYIGELRYIIGNLMGNVSMYNGMKDFLYMYNVYVSY